MLRLQLIVCLTAICACDAGEVLPRVAPSDAVGTSFADTGQTHTDAQTAGDTETPGEDAQAPPDAPMAEDTGEDDDIIAGEDATLDTGLSDVAAADIRDADGDLSDATEDTIDWADIDEGDASEPSGDLGPTDDIDVSPVESLCTVTELDLSCPHQSTTIWSGFAGLEPREVHWQLPLGEPPAAGWPVVFFFQGSLFSSEYTWYGLANGPFGMWYQAATLKELLDRGYAVITPEGHVDGSTWWDTNIPPYNTFWSTAPDHQFMLDLLNMVGDGEFGDIDATRIFATGISSGGYMASRVAITYGNVRAIAVHSASYATCASAACFVPSLPDDHPPTLFLHGAADVTVPVWTMELYFDELSSMGIATDKIVDNLAIHEWIEAAPTAIADWFDTY